MRTHRRRRASEWRFHPFRGMFVSAVCPTMLACASKRGIVGEITSDEYQLAKAQLLHG